MFAKLDDNGDPEKRKVPGKDQQGNPKLFKEERKMTEVMMNYYIIEQVEIIAFVEAFAINSGKIDYMSILMDKGALVEAPKPSIIRPSLISKTKKTKASERVEQSTLFVSFI